MITKRHLITAVLATFCLATLVFMVVPTRSQTTLEYDPWKDINDDGKLDILDIVQISSQYGAQGNPTKNVTVTNWPDFMMSGGAEYVAFNCKFGTMPTVFNSYDGTTYSTGIGTVIDFTVDGTKYASRLSSGAYYLLNCNYATGSVTNLVIHIIVNGVTHDYSLPSTNYVMVPFQSDFIQIDQTRTDNRIVVQLGGASGGNHGSVQGLRSTLHLGYYKQVLTTADFGFAKIYLKSVILQPQDAVNLNNDPTQTLANANADALTIEFSDKVLVNRIEILCGTPEMVLYGKVGT